MLLGCKIPLLEIPLLEHNVALYDQTSKADIL